MELLARLVLLIGTALLATPPTTPPTTPPISGPPTRRCPPGATPSCVRGSGPGPKPGPLRWCCRTATPPRTRRTRSAGGSAAGAWRSSSSFSADEDLATYRAEQIDPFVDEGGDDGIEDTVTYQSGVPVFGATTGEVLTYQPYNDGSPLDVLVVQANGVRLELETDRGDLGDHQVAFDMARSSLAVVAANRDGCSARGRTISYALPRGVRDVTSYGGPCVLYLRPGRGLGHTATFTVAPRNPAPQPTSTLHVAERDGFRLVWKTPADRWPAERAMFRRLLHSVVVGS